MTIVDISISITITYICICVESLNPREGRGDRHGGALWRRDFRDFNVSDCPGKGTIKVCQNLFVWACYVLG